MLIGSWDDVGEYSANWASVSLLWRVSDLVGGTVGSNVASVLCVSNLPCLNKGAEKPACPESLSCCDTNQVLWHNSEQALGVDYSSFPYSATMTNARFRWSLKQGFHTAVHGTETAEIDCRCSKQLWQMNVPSINIWKVNKGNKSAQRMGKK